MLKESYFIFLIYFEKFCQRKTHKQEKKHNKTQIEHTVTFENTPFAI